MRPQRGKTRAEARAPGVIVRRETLNMAAMHPRFPPDPEPVAQFKRTNAGSARRYGACQ
jgi:hypothetical protein